MRFLILTSLLAAACHAASPASSPAPASYGWGFEAGLRLGSIFGGMRDKDETFYKGVGLNIVNKTTGAQQDLDLGVMAISGDLAVYKAVSPRSSVGFGASFLGATSGPNNPGMENADQPFLDQQSYTLRFKFMPVANTNAEGGTFFLTIEPAIGYSLASLRRYGLAAEQLDGALDSLYPLSKLYISTANQSLSASGPHLELVTSVGSRKANGFRYGVGLGLEYTMLELGSDPLSNWTWKGERYPTSLDHFGVCLRLQLGFGA